MPTYPRIENTDYFTNRALENEKGEKSGKIVMWRVKGENQFHVVLKCPFCGKDQEYTQAFEKRPYRPACQSCGKNFVISKIKPEKKKDK